MDNNMENREMRLLDKYEKQIYESIIHIIRPKTIECWDHTAPEDFENHIPCEDSKKW